MREKRFRQKIAKRAIVPAWLVQFFGEVDAKIQRRDAEAVTASDDFIQDSGIVGGLIEDGGDMYHFTVFPGPDNPINRPKWDLTLSSAIIHQIAEEELKHLDLWECDNPECMSLFSTPESVCIYCDYHDDERDERDRVKMALLSRTFKDKEEWIRAYLEHFPDDHPYLILGQYNSTGLGEELGWFCGADVKSIVEQFKSSAQETKAD